MKYFGQEAMLIFNRSKPVTWSHLISRERELVSPLNLGVEAWILMCHMDPEMVVVVVVVVAGGSEIFRTWEIGCPRVASPWIKS